MPAIQNVRVYEDSSFQTLIHTFPQGQTNESDTELACSDPGNHGRAAQFTKGTQYYLKYTLVDPGSFERRVQGDCAYEAGGEAPVSFEELELAD